MIQQKILRKNKALLLGREQSKKFDNQIFFQ